MRVRNIPNVEALLQGQERYIEHPEIYKGKWQGVFQNQNPLHIEIGMGKGRFLSTLAEEHPHINYLGIEKSQELIWKALKGMEGRSFNNIRLTYLMAEHLTQVFEPGEVERIYLNFSDPWPKARHEKRRLTHLRFLEQYRLILSPGGELHMKTDDPALFEFTLESLEKAKYQIHEVIRDLHRVNPQGVVMTEYEARFIAQGKAIHRVIASID